MKITRLKALAGKNVAEAKQFITKARISDIITGVVEEEESGLVLFQLPHPDRLRAKERRYPASFFLALLALFHIYETAQSIEVPVDWFKKEKVYDFIKNCYLSSSFPVTATSAYKLDLSTAYRMVGFEPGQYDQIAEPWAVLMCDAALSGALRSGQAHADRGEVVIFLDGGGGKRPNTLLFLVFCFCYLSFWDCCRYP